MKKIAIILSGLLFTCLTSFAYNVTFKVDMSNVSGFSAANVNGTFNNWCGACAAMTDANADNIWEITIDLPAGTYEYKFTADGWNQQENLTPGSACTVTNFGYTNRSITVSADTVLPTVCWGACAACSNVYPVTFKVDMNNVTSAYTTPTVNGTFNGWSGNATPLSDANADGIYETTLQLAPGTYEYKFAADNWAIQENLIQGMSCTTTNFGYTNRTFTLGNSGLDLGVVCWESCTTCDQTPSMYNVTFQLDMSTTTGFTTPEVNGTFNNWCGSCAAMSDANADGIWEITIPLQAGAYEFKYSYDGWAGSENLTEGSECTVTNGGFTNRLLIVNGDSTLSPVCFGLCTSCNPIIDVLGCTDDNAANYNSAANIDDNSCLYTTLFNVDMSCADAFTDVYITGPWCGWCAADTYNHLTDIDGDGIYSVSLLLPLGDVEYKYMVDNWASQENLIDDMQNGGTCAPVTDFVNYANRQIEVGITTNDTYGQCSVCGGVAPDPCDLLTLEFEDAGSLNYWYTVGDATLPEASMTWDETGALRLSGSNTSSAMGKAYIFEYLNNNLNYNGNTSVEIAFDLKSDGVLVGTAIHLQTEFPGTGVTNIFDIQNTGINENTWTHFTYTFSNVSAANSFRMHFNIAAGAFLGAGGILLVDNIELNCYTPTEVLGCTDPTALNYNPAATQDDSTCTYPETFNVTFRVDMQNETGFTIPEVNGTFNNWCGNCAPMSDINSDNIWETTVQLNAGNYEYKYSYDSWAGQENLIAGSSCTVTNFGFTNRTLVVSQDVVLDLVCFGSCTSCQTTLPTHQVTFQLNMNQTTGFTTPEVNGTFNGWCGNCAQMSDGNGDNIWDITIPLQEGSYEFKYSHDNWAGSENLTPGDLCTFTNGGFTNRYITISNDTIIPVVCYGSCSDCQAPATYPVIFHVDVNDPTITQVEITGDFNNFCVGCETMNNGIGTLWTDTLYLEAGVYNYHYTHTNGTVAEVLTDMTCTVASGNTFERTITVTADTEAPVVCWNTCSECTVGTDEWTNNNIQLFPNPTTGNISFSGLNGGNYQVTCHDMVGNLVRQFNVSAESKNIQLSNLDNGLYIIRIEGDHVSQQFSVVLCD